MPATHLISAIWEQLLLSSGGCGRTIIPCPCTHYTSRLHYFTWVGILRLPQSLHCFVPYSRGGTVCSSFFMHKILPGFSSRSKLEGWPQDTISVCIDVFLTDWVDGVGCMLSLPISDCVFSCHFIVETGPMVFSTLFICCGYNYLLGFLLSCFGHVGPRTTLICLA